MNVKNVIKFLFQPKEFSDPMELVKGINYLNNKPPTDPHLGVNSGKLNIAKSANSCEKQTNF